MPRGGGPSRLPAYNPGMQISPLEERVTLATLRRMVRQGRKIPMLTCYDATTARWLARGGVPALLVGDSAGQMILGYEHTIQAPLGFMLTITAAVRRGAPKAFVMADMPFMSYQADDAEAVRNAGRFMVEGGADAVKLEVNEGYSELVAKLARAGVPVVAHIGWRPQRTQQVGVPVVAGRTDEKIAELVALAELMQRQGAAMLLVEQTTAEAAERVVEAVGIPVIGCGAGPACHGHVIILQDWLGMTDWSPSFVQPLTNGGDALAQAGAAWVELVQGGRYLADDHPYKMTPRSQTAGG